MDAVIENQKIQDESNGYGILMESDCDEEDSSKINEHDDDFEDYDD